jgi:hypothetical protein
LLAPDRHAHSPLAERIVGTWSLVSYVLRRARGADVFPLGADPLGFISFTRGKRMSVQMSARERAPFAVRGLLSHGTLDELAAAARGYLAYAGPYDVDEERNTLSHFVEVSLYPNWVGTTQLREATIDGARLVLAAPESRDDGARRARRRDVATY